MKTETERSTDRIQKSVILRAPRSEVWRALVDPRALGAWFGLDVPAHFFPGARITAKIAPTTVDPEIARQQRPYAGMPVEITIERLDPERCFAFRWHPFARNASSQDEPETLVSFDLEETRGGVTLTITESGFDRLPAERRAAAYRANEDGWTKQAKLIEKYLSRRLEPRGETHRHA